MKVLPKNRLELHWESVNYKGESAILKGAYLCGPVFKDAAELRQNDSLVLDMTEQHKLLLPEYYQATLFWRQVEYKEEKVFLPGAMITGKYVNSTYTLRDTDWILIDCKNHDEKNHPYHLVYYSKVMKKEGEDKY